MIKGYLNGCAGNLGPETSELDFTSFTARNTQKELSEWPWLSLLESTKPSCQSAWLNVINWTLQEWGSDHFCCTNNLSGLLCSTLESNKKVPPQKMSLNLMPSSRPSGSCFKRSNLLWWPWNKLNFHGLQNKAWPYLKTERRVWSFSYHKQEDRLSLSHLELLHYFLWTKQSIMNSDPKTRTKRSRSISIPIRISHG